MCASEHMGEPRMSGGSETPTSEGPDVGHPTLWVLRDLGHPPWFPLRPGPPAVIRVV